jgi:hypothetical protein
MSQIDLVLDMIREIDLVLDMIRDEVSCTP